MAKQPLMVRADAGNDAVETLVALEDAEKRPTTLSNGIPVAAMSSPVMALCAFAYNILSFIGEAALIGPLGSVRHSAKNRRLRSVIQELMYLAARLLTTGRQLQLRFSAGITRPLPPPALCTRG